MTNTITELRTWESESEVPEGFATLHITDPTGDTRLMWDPRIKDEVDTARAAFDAAKKKGMVGYLVDPDDGSKGEVVNEFPKKAGKLIMVKQLQGG